jgi:hypothetical protein
MSVTEKMVRVIDIPPDTTAEEAEVLLNRPYEEGYYLASVVGWDRFGARAFYRRRLITKSGENKSDRGGNRSDRDGLDKAARAIVQANPRRTIRAIQHALADAGIRRSVGWVSNARADLRELR